MASHVLLHSHELGHMTDAARAQPVRGLIEPHHGVAHGAQ